MKILLNKQHAYRQAKEEITKGTHEDGSPMISVMLPYHGNEEFFPKYETYFSKRERNIERNRLIELRVKYLMCVIH